MLFIWNFDESVISVLPPGEVPFSSYEEQTTSSGTLSKKIDLATRKMYETGSFSIGTSDQQGRTTIRRECKNFYHFIKGGNDAMNGIRRESMFINLLQGLHPLEAELLCLVKDKDLDPNTKLLKTLCLKHILIFSGETALETYEKFYLKTAVKNLQKIVISLTTHF